MLKGLNSIRFLCALWVVFGHFGVPPLALVIDKSTTLGLVLNGIYNNCTSGPSAVIVFFVISGFCIHYPHSERNEIPSIGAYIARRFMRILGPLAAALVISGTVIPINLPMFEKSVLWSLLAELIYYSLYPAFLWVRRSQTSWLVMIAVSFVLAFAVAATDPLAGDYPSYGPWLNWLLGLPCWLLGCKLGEHVRMHPSQPVTHSISPLLLTLFWPSIWQLRAGLFMLSWVCSALRFHSPLTYPWTLNLFAIAVAFWLMREIYHFQSKRPLAGLEWAGSWSYSLYLGHPLAMAVLWRVPTPDAGVIGTWLFHMTIILAFSYLFAVLFEFPSHALARAGSAWVRRSCDKFTARYPKTLF
jgi:peptidoglycan/LPS O-acetylase OafA/YrhL